MNQLSAGQLTRVNLAKSLINFPRVLLLDEPTASLDPEVASYIREFLQEQRKQHNVSIIITSHNMGEVEELCDRVLFINHGKIVADDTPGNLAKTMEICHVHLSIDKHMQWLKEYMQKEHLQHTIENDTVLIDLKEKQIGAFLQHIGKEGVEYSELSIDKPNLEDYFIQMVKQHETT
jgi:ABC-2 type transport system ATP-binding protein